MIDMDRGEGKLLFERVYYIARFTDYQGVNHPVFARVTYSHDGRLSFIGVEGPKRGGNAHGSSGQIIMGWREHPGDWTTNGSDFSKAQLDEFMALWDRWHLNDMRADCEHQRAEKWGERPIDPDKPLSSYGRHFDGQRDETWNMLGWVRPSEHPAGLLGVPCPTCGYKYGTAWLTEPVPAEVLERLASFPEATKTPAWIQNSTYAACKQPHERRAGP